MTQPIIQLNVASTLDRQRKRLDSVDATLSGRFLLAWLRLRQGLRSKIVSQGRRVLTYPSKHNICRPITVVQCRPNVFDVGPTLYKCFTDGLCLLGYWDTWHQIKPNAWKAVKWYSLALDVTHYAHAKLGTLKGLPRSAVCYHGYTYF